MTGKLPQGTLPWFDMVGSEIVKAAKRVGLPPDFSLSVIERYTDGAELGDGLRQGLRIDVADSALTYRVGVFWEERADVMIEVTSLTARQLNLLFGDDPDYRRTLEEVVAQGAMRVTGDLGPLGPVFDSAHDGIVIRTG